MNLERECEACGRFGLKRQQVPSPGEPEFAPVCPDCGHVHDTGDDADKYVQKR